MADYMNPTNYNNMIEALNTFAAKTLETCEKLNTACTQCISVLGQEDVATAKITTNASVICAKYEELILEARRIALKMQQVRHAPTSRPKPKPGAPGLRQRDHVLLALCHSTRHNQPLTFIHSFRKYLSQVYYVSDPVLDTEVIQRTKSKDAFPIVGQNKE